STVMIPGALELRKLAISASLLVVALLVFAPQTWAQTSVGTVGVANGNVSIVRAGKSIPTAAGTALRVGDKVTTGPKSHLTISLTDGSQLELDESSTLVLTEYVLNPDGSRASTKLTLLGGLVRSLVHLGPSNAPNFEVHTPNAVASARGTMFDVAYHEGQPPPAIP
ncbi:MAG TPA: FecR family protein, partial [Candidatus Binataceae bacterium]